MLIGKSCPKILSMLAAVLLWAATLPGYADPRSLSIGLEAGSVGIFPTSGYTAIANAGVGPDVTASLENVFLPGLLFFVDGGYSFMSPTSQEEDLAPPSSLGLAALRLGAGYRFEFFERRMCADLRLSAGYCAHVLSAGTASGTYYDPTFGAALALGYTFANGLGLRLIPTFNLFLEKSTVSTYFGIGAVMAYSLPLGKRSSDKADSATAAPRAIATNTRAPEVALSLEPSLFSPDGDGNADTCVLQLQARDEAGLGGWRVEVFEPNGSLFFSQSGTGNPPPSLAWDGKDANGVTVESATQYAVTFTAADAAGNAGTATATLRTDLLLVPTANGYSIRIPTLVFSAYKDSDEALDASWRDRNAWVLSRLSDFFLRHPEYRIVITGHANSLLASGSARAAEERDVLVPLSLSRGRNVRTWLAGLGVPMERMEIHGAGGSKPVVKDNLNNAENWKNRRVEFELVRQEEK